MMCAATAAQRGKRVIVLDHAKKLAEKIRISGGGRCNFTNIHAAPSCYLSRNPHFCKSALRQYTQHDFIAMVQRYNIPYHEKKLGQLFCDNSAQDIIDMLQKECLDAGVVFDRPCEVTDVDYADNQYEVRTGRTSYQADALVIATGGLSIPKIGATPFGYQIAEQFGLSVLPVRAGLVPLTFQNDMLEFCRNLSGVSVDAHVMCGKTGFREGLLFTHRGLSGPSILQISSYWQEGENLTINLAPDHNIFDILQARKSDTPKQEVKTILSDYLPGRLAESLCQSLSAEGRIADMPKKMLQHMAQHINAWSVQPSGTEGYRTAEVTLGGVDTDQISSKTMEVKTQGGLYFIGEVLDVTGHLGGYNFQWAWSSGYVAGMNV